MIAPTAGTGTNLATARVTTCVPTPMRSGHARARHRASPIPLLTALATNSARSGDDASPTTSAAAPQRACSDISSSIRARSPVEMLGGSGLLRRQLRALGGGPTAGILLHRRVRPAAPRPRLRSRAATSAGTTASGRLGARPALGAGGRAARAGPSAPARSVGRRRATRQEVGAARHHRVGRHQRVDPGGETSTGVDPPPRRRAARWSPRCPTVLERHRRVGEALRAHLGVRRTRRHARPGLTPWCRSPVHLPVVRRRKPKGGGGAPAEPDGSAAGEANRVVWFARCARSRPPHLPAEVALDERQVGAELAGSSRAGRACGTPGPVARTRSAMATAPPRSAAR